MQYDVTMSVRVQVEALNEAEAREQAFREIIDNGGWEYADVEVTNK